MDIYFNEKYGKLGEYIDKGECRTFVLDTKNGLITNMFIYREIPWKIGEANYYDIITPYGYGGPIVRRATDIHALIEDYKREFSQYCLNNNIVSEFIRYHPIYRNWEPFDGVYENLYSRHTVGTNLRDFDDPVQEEFSKSARKEIRRAKSNGISCKLIVHPSDLRIFKNLYEETLRRNNAEEMYYFPEEYYRIFESDLSGSVLEIQAILEDEVIASEIYLIESNHMHAHLLGSNDKLLEFDGGALIEATAAKWGKEHGYVYIHHGGGRTSSDDDPLYRYKKKFGKHTTFEFYIGRKIWNSPIYYKLLEERKKHGPITNTSFFPEYRAD